MMDASARKRFARLTGLFDTLCVLPPSQREPAIQRECGADRSLADELRSMLAADVQEGGPDAVWELIGPYAEAMASPDRVGTTIGVWRLVRPLGEGGMGVVYLAERADGAFEASAAIKLVHSPVPSADRDQRFVAERQILAGLSHPGIARLLDGGTTDEGSPYLVMEFVDGVPVTQWCQSAELALRARLRLFLKICDAVAYAHHQLVAHLDLKPSNMLVTGDGDIKLLDFGIAKLLGTAEPDAHVEPLMLMTPAYASPEQLLGKVTGVATDVYALGVIAFELVTGRLPLSSTESTPRGWTAVIAEQVPPLASAVAPPATRRALRGDLDAVIARALAKDPARRYESVRRFAEDLRRHLDGEPVSVRREEFGYRAGRFVRRHALAVTMVVGVVAGSVGFSWYAGAQARSLAQERDLAQRQRATAQRVGMLLEQVFTEADPNVASGAELTVRQALDRGAAGVLSELQHEPEIRAAISTVIGRVYRNLGELEAAEPLLDDALAVREGAWTTDPVELATSRIERAALHYDRGELDAALAMFSAAHAGLAAAFTDDHILMVDTLGWLSSTNADLGRLDQAQAEATQSLQLAQRFYDAPDAAIANAMNGLAGILRAQGKFDEALRLGHDALQQYRAVHGDNHLDVAHVCNHLSQTLARLDRLEEALGYAQEGLAIRRAVHPGSHGETAASLGAVAGILADLKRFEEAEAARLESLVMMRDVFGEEHPYVAGTLSSLGAMLADAGRPVEAEQVLRESVAMHKKVYPLGNPKVAYPLTSLGKLLLEQGHAEQAHAVLKEGLQARRDGLPAGHWHIALSSLEQGRALDALGRDQEAEAMLLSGYRGLKAEFGEDHRRLIPARAALRAHYARRGLPDKAAAFADAAPADAEKSPPP